MIEFCTFRRMVLFIIGLIVTSLVVLAIESFLTPSNGKYPEHPGGQGENTSSAPCWQNEDYVVKQHCAPCSEFEKVSRHLPACVLTGFKEMVSCKVSGEVYRSCDKVLWLEERNFFIFESCMTCFSIIGAMIVSFRQKQLDQRMMMRIQQQISAGV
ncbi:protein JTB [Trichonephila clavipes]|uniref:Protein JTB n=1 Tax=Trichonephila clavata TaxID=2740835 RepID=A0A8X6F167_TRICU|nr:protein JTB [Trichonephila clavata]GFX84684.1 protein JTB [Trichonephila clavipes]